VLGCFSDDEPATVDGHKLTGLGECSRASEQAARRVPVEAVQLMACMPSSFPASLLPSTVGVRSVQYNIRPAAHPATKHCHSRFQ
jgi:hypothetical protein